MVRGFLKKRPPLTNHQINNNLAPDAVFLLLESVTNALGEETVKALGVPAVIHEGRAAFAALKNEGEKKKIDALIRRLSESKARLDAYYTTLRYISDRAPVVVSSVVTLMRERGTPKAIAEWYGKFISGQKAYQRFQNQMWCHQQTNYSYFDGGGCVCTFFANEVWQRAERSLHSAVFQATGELTARALKMYRDGRKMIDTPQGQPSSFGRVFPIGEVAFPPLDNILACNEGLTATLTIQDRWSYHLSVSSHPLAGVPTLLTVVKGFAMIAVVDLNLALSQSFGFDDIPAFLAFLNNQVLTMLCVCGPGDSVWCPYGHVPIVIALGVDDYDTDNQKLFDCAYTSLYFLINDDIPQNGPLASEIKAHLTRGIALDREPSIFSTKDKKLVQDTGEFFALRENTASPNRF